MHSYDTMTEAINDLARRGYTHDFNVENDYLISKANSIKLTPDEFEIDEFYRFEGVTDPGDENIVYAISSTKQNLKGVFVNAFGTYSDGLGAAIISKLKKHMD